MSDMKENGHLSPGDLLQGRRVYLRLPRVDELSFIRTLWADPETMAPVGGPVDFPETKARTWFARMVDPGGPSNCYCLIFNQDDVPVGEISFHRWDPEARSAGLNVKVLAAHRGNGYAKAALRTFLACFFGQIDGRLITDNVAIRNRTGQQALLRFGFEHDAGVKDVFMLRMTRERFISLYGLESLLSKTRFGN
jgi:RimJ/RimL family protein N-acetyltransferase